jgi:hypothetical protein
MLNERRERCTKHQKKKIVPKKGNIHENSKKGALFYSRQENTCALVSKSQASKFEKKRGDDLVRSRYIHSQKFQARILLRFRLQSIPAPRRAGLQETGNSKKLLL